MCSALTPSRIIHGHQPQSLWLAGQAFRFVDASWQADGGVRRRSSRTPGFVAEPRPACMALADMRSQGAEPDQGDSNSATSRLGSAAARSRMRSCPNFTPASERPGLPARDCAQGLDKESNTCSNRGMETSVIDPFPSVSAALGRRTAARRPGPLRRHPATLKWPYAAQQAQFAVLTAEPSSRIQAMGYPLNGAAEDWPPCWRSSRAALDRRMDTAIGTVRPGTAVRPHCTTGASTRPKPS